MADVKVVQTKLAAGPKGRTLPGAVVSVSQEEYDRQRSEGIPYCRLATPEEVRRFESTGELAGGAIPAAVETATATADTETAAEPAPRRRRASASD